MSSEVNIIAVYVADGFGVFLAIMMLGARIWKNGTNSDEKKLIRFLIIAAMLSCIADSISCGFDGVPGTLSFYSSYISNLWLYFANMLIGTLWVVLLLVHISGRNLPNYQIALMVTIDLVGVVTLIVNFFSPIVFSVDRTTVLYSRGPVFWIDMVVEVIFCADLLITYFVMRRKHATAKYFPVLSFIIPIVVGVSVQMAFYGVSTMCPAMIVSIYGVILGLFNENEAEADILRQNEDKSKIIIEQQKKVEETLEKARLAGGSENKSLYFGTTDDISTHINDIMDFAAMASRYAGDKDRARDYIFALQQSENMLKSIFDDVLEISSVEAGKAVLEERAFDVRYSFSGVQGKMGELAEVKDIKLSFEYGEIADRHVLADSGRCAKILEIVITNAIKYTPKGGAVRVRCEQLGEALDGVGTYQYTVTDNGIGMGEEYKNHIFEMFSRERTEYESGIQGKGLGMSLVKAYAELMNGDVAVQSGKGKGTTVTITLPFRL